MLISVDFNLAADKTHIKSLGRVHTGDVTAYKAVAVFHSRRSSYTWSDMSFCCPNINFLSSSNIIDCNGYRSTVEGPWPLLRMTTHVILVSNFSYDMVLYYILQKTHRENYERISINEKNNISHLRVYNTTDTGRNRSIFINLFSWFSGRVFCTRSIHSGPHSWCQRIVLAANGITSLSLTERWTCPMSEMF